MFGMSNFHSLEVVGRGSERQLQMGENLDKITQWFKGKYLFSEDCIQAYSIILKLRQ